MQPGTHGDRGASVLRLPADLCPLGLTMISTESTGGEDGAEPPCIRLDPLTSTHLPGKAPPTDGSPKVTANGVPDIEDRILRITGYYGYNPGYSSHRSE
ncbi:unnamed protein product [Pleuronectes platessa]|uniref:Uncharacterized protein n=1 Tax=Pleuronectes platessa TaxID=8262 RepID=A0A9N7Y7M7_PLEPL|nr:unnamed protein product [Pleuronectes platessa]